MPKTKEQCEKIKEERAKAPVIGYYCFFETTNGYVQELYWTKEKMELHAKTYSPGYVADLKKGTDFTFWSKDFDGMAKKTMLKQISKFAPMSVDLVKAIESDQAVINEDGTYNYIDGNDNEDIVEAATKVDENGVVIEAETDSVKEEVPPKKGDDLADELNK